MTRTWVLNPGAEREILSERPSPDRRTVAQMEERSWLFDDLCAGEPRVWLEDLRKASTPPRPSRRALLWCPTPIGQSICRAAGLLPQPAPSADVLRRVLSKAFLTTAVPGHTVPHHRVIRSLDEYRDLRAKVAVPLRAKRLDGYAGKGQRTLSASPRPGDELWIEQLSLRGGFIVEAELECRGEFSVHGVVTEQACVLGQPCRIQTDDARAPLAVPTPCPDVPLAGEIRRRGEDVARALLAAGYQGPFGLDLILSEQGLFATDLNARFTLGFSAGLGALREQALELVLGAE